MMAHSFNAFHNEGATLKRICVAQAIVSLSALTSTALLLSKLLPTMMNDFH
ncbi:hypothetical protein IVB30_31120 [Bradyrhizobium sp. 200]|uniref:hypothetical protein n=1 Tax=Bradyrhizobium sp. 200 TaxID=2782665 RepID=UPI001FFEC97F|nr:hypothetical protein [Bradyrhizobium sp. 200]UPJ47681.1 hypothetical protein IVB30_31120 [Bradyrhizobium sp. 200]